MKAMFNVDGYSITLSRGDTGAIRFTAETDYVFDAADRALFSVKNAVGEVVKQQAYELTDKSFVVSFFNSDTDTLAAGVYSWDVRYIIHPYYDSAGNIVDGDQVITPRQPMDLQLLQVVGEV
jgi:hypothetical protein